MKRTGDIYARYASQVMGHSHVPRPHRQHWWQFWRPKAQAVVVGTMRGPDEYAAAAAAGQEWAKRWLTPGAYVGKIRENATPLVCRDCPWQHGDITERDCDYPHCTS